MIPPFSLTSNQSFPRLCFHSVVDNSDTQRSHYACVTFEILQKHCIFKNSPVNLESPILSIVTPYHTTTIDIQLCNTIVQFTANQFFDTLM